MPRQLREGLVLVAIAAVVFLTGLGGTRLWDDDETFFAQTAREMFERGDLVVPWFNQTLFAHKPPFMYWMMIGAYQIFGVTEFAARLPSAIFGIASVLLVWRLGRILYSPPVGFWAGIILATSLNFIVIARAATCDAELVVFCTLPLYLFVRGTATRRDGPGTTGARLSWSTEDASRNPSWKTYVAVYVSMGMAVMIKGPIGVLLPTSVLGLFLLCRRSIPAHGAGSKRGWRAISDRLVAWLAPRHVLQTIWQMRPLTAIALVALVAGPWFVAVAWQTHGEFLAGFFGVHHFHRFTSPMDNHPGPPVYYLLAICVGFFPWSIFLSPCCIELVRRMRHNDLDSTRSNGPADALLVAWIIVWVGFFSLASTKFPHYVIPAYPALALLTACFFDRWISETAIYGKLARRAAWATVALVGAGILIVVPFVARDHLPGEQLLCLAGLPLIPGAALGAWLAERQQVARALACLTATAALFFVGLFAWAAPRVDRHQNTAPFAAAIHERCPDRNARIATYQYFRPGFVYYCNERVEQFYDAPSATTFLRESSGNSFLVTTEDEYREFKNQLGPQVGIIQRGAWFLKQGKTLVLLGDTTNRLSAQPAGTERQ
jgi:4-amino-4-deoxy-L-arabinose transferase-like glycosyltransferase